MKRPNQLIGFSLATACAFALALPTPAAAQVSEQDFNALKKMVEDLNTKVNKLQQQHDQDQQAHTQDQQQIQQLKQQLTDTQKTATDAQQKADAASQVQTTKPLPGEGLASHNFTMVGDAEVQFGKVDGKHSAFALADFAPIFLFRGGDRVLFEAGFDVTLQNGAPGQGGSSTSVSMSFGQLDYLINDYFTFCGGQILLPLGTYSERAAGWLNKIPDDPMPRDLVPGSAVGVELRGSAALGQSGQSITYAAFVDNGPSSIDGSATAANLDLGGNVGILNDGNLGNLHGSPSYGGRVGWFMPWKPHYDLELGISGQTGMWDNNDQYRWSAGVIDAALHVSPYFELKGEYIHSWVETSDVGTIKPKGWWIQAGYKMAGLDLELPLINNLELVGRYDRFEDGLGSRANRWTMGYIYYLSNTLLFEGDYEIRSSDNPDQSHNELIFQLSYGF